jgi:uncharacterized protein YjiS (DUF1127 family)
MIKAEHRKECAMRDIDMSANGCCTVQTPLGTPHAGKGWFQAMLGSARSWIAAHRQDADDRAVLESMENLDQRMLDDIGLSLADIHEAKQNGSPREAIERLRIQRRRNIARALR